MRVWLREGPQEAGGRKERREEQIRSYRLAAECISIFGEDGGKTVS